MTKKKKSDSMRSEETEEYTDDIQEEEEKPVKQESIRRMKPTEWAIEDGIDHHLFLHWANQLMSREEYEKLKEKVMR